MGESGVFVGETGELGERAKGRASKRLYFFLFGKNVFFVVAVIFSVLSWNGKTQTTKNKKENIVLLVILIEE